MTLATLRDVHRVHGAGASATTALAGVSVEIRAGTMTVVVGPSGSGKTTFLNLVGALDRATRGSVSIDGVALEGADDATLSALRRDRLGFVFQSFNLLPELSAWENVALPELAAGGALRRGRARALDLLDLVAMRHRSDHRPNELSGGEMQRVAIARALMNDPLLVLADEPTGNLDSKAGSRVLELLRSLPVSGHRSVVMVTHDRTVEPLADRVLEFADGRIVGDSAAEGAPSTRSSAARRPLKVGAAGR